MTTIRELHQKAGNPNLTHWRSMTMFTVAEAALLAAAFDPLEFSDQTDHGITQELKNKKPKNWQHALLLMRSIAEAICSQEIKSPYIDIDRTDWNNSWNEIVEQARVSIADARHVIYTSTKIHREEMYKWLKKNGYVEAIQHVEVQVNNVQKYPQESIVNNDIALLPEPTYTTAALECIKGVVQHFWVDHNPETDQAPLQKQVKAWIAENYPDMNTDYMQTAIDKICRHPTAKTGGNKKVNIQNTIKDVTPIK
jgi:hypothetical protein